MAEQLFISSVSRISACHKAKKGDISTKSKEVQKVINVHIELLVALGVMSVLSIYFAITHFVWRQQMSLLEDENEDLRKRAEIAFNLAKNLKERVKS
jgi:hypothetical protein